MTMAAANDGVRPAPLTPEGCDLRNFLRMPLEVGRLLASETWIAAVKDPRIGHALMSLWAESWRQVPAGSLPDNDVTLERLSMCPTSKEWQRVRARVRESWVLCSDGRLYHPTVCEMALEGLLEKLSSRRRGAAGNVTRWGGASFDPAQLDAEVERVRAMLAALNPNSQALTKKRPAGRPAHGGDGSQGHPGGGTPGANAPPSAIPQRSLSDPSAIAEGSPEDRNRREGKGYPPNPPQATAVDNFSPRLPAGRWWETRGGIEAAGAACGIDRWDEEAFGLGRGEHWPAYRERVLIAAGDGPWLDSGVRLPAHAAGLLRVGGVH